MQSTAQPLAGVSNASHWSPVPAYECRGNDGKRVKVVILEGG